VSGAGQVTAKTKFGFPAEFAEDAEVAVTLGSSVVAWYGSKAADELG
jgi:hypothetical protein